MDEVLAQANDKLQDFKKDNDMLRSDCPVYIGKVSDETDIALQNFLNDSSNHERFKPKILFIRESQGIYRFGSMRVGIQLDQNNTLIVQSDQNDYTQSYFIGDFLEQFTI